MDIFLKNVIDIVFIDDKMLVMPGIYTNTLRMKGGCWWKTCLICMVQFKRLVLFDVGTIPFQYPSKMFLIDFEMVFVQTRPSFGL